MRKINRLTEEIRAELFRLRDPEYRELQVRTIPTLDAETVIGVRTPTLRAYAKVLIKHPDVISFLKDLPHKYFDENQIHAFIISEIKNYDACISQINAFLPYVDNWATCDQMSPKVFAKHRDELLNEIRNWMDSDQTYTIRFGIGMLMQHYLKDAFDPSYPEMVAAIRSEEYYVNMMIAWYFATALAEQYETVIPYIEGRRLDDWTHQKTIQKAIESYRITEEQKAYLRTLKINSKSGQKAAQKQAQKAAQNQASEATPSQNQKAAQIAAQNDALLSKPMKRIHVAAAIFREGGRILATQRGYGDWKDYWEFPGGKIEPGETPEDALVREIREELDTEIMVVDKLMTVEYDYPEFHLSMDCFFTEVISGSLVLKEHEAARWLAMDELDEVNWLPADREIIRELTKGGTA